MNTTVNEFIFSSADGSKVAQNSVTAALSELVFDLTTGPLRELLTVEVGSMYILVLNRRKFLGLF
jgi:hypothetical protein